MCLCCVGSTASETDAMMFGLCFVRARAAEPVDRGHQLEAVRLRGLPALPVDERHHLLFPVHDLDQAVHLQGASSRSPVRLPSSSLRCILTAAPTALNALFDRCRNPHEARLNRRMSSSSPDSAAANHTTIHSLVVIWLR